MKRTCIQAVVGVLFFAALVHQLHAELDCRKYPFYYRCRGISAKRSFAPITKMEAMSLKELYEDDDGWKNRRRPAQDAVLGWVRNKYGDDIFDPDEPLDATRGSFERKELY